MVNSAKPDWRPVRSRVSPGSILGPVLFNIFIKDLDDVVQCTLNKFAGDTKLRAVAHVRAAVIQGDLDRLERWAGMKFNKEKCRVPFLSVQLWLCL